MVNEDLCQANLKFFQCFENDNIPLERNNTEATSNVYGYQPVEVCKK